MFSIDPVTDEQVLIPKLRRAFWMGALALVGVGLTVLLLGWLNQRSLSLMLESQTIGRLAREARALALDRETSIRGYLISRKEISLAPDLGARRPLAAKLDSLVRLSSGNASQQDRARTIKAAVERWERGWAVPVLDEVSAGIPFSDRESTAGKELFDSIRSAFDSFSAGEQRIFGMRVKMLGGLQAFGIGLLIVEIITLLAVLLGLSRRALNQTRTLLTQREELQAQAIDLQHQTALLEEQTLELEEQADESNRTANTLAETNRNLEQTIRRLEDAESRFQQATSHEKELESLLDAMFRNSPVGIALFDSRRRIVRMNSAMEGIAGIPAASQTGRTVSEIAGDDLGDLVDEHVQAVLTTGASLANVPISGPENFAAGDRHFLCSFFPVTLPGGKGGVGTVVLETTHFKQLEEQLVQSQKMEAVGRLAGGVAHDFNNMLTAILSYSEILLADMPSSGAQRADMLEIVRAAQKAANLTRKLLAFSRQQVLRPTRVDLNATIGGLQNIMKRLLGNDVELSFERGTDLWTVSIDPTEIERVIMNLVLNSRDAMPGGGKLLVETSNVTIDEDYAAEHADTKPGAYVMIAVTDTGSGMTREVRDKLFEPFFTTKANGHGTGLGLPSVYGIVKQSGGFIWVYSELGKGTTFKIYLPRAAEPESHAPRTPSRNRTVGSETILLVEDNEEVRNVATRILRRNGYRVLEASNGAEALKVCESEDQPMDLIVTDIVMPEMEGTELARRLRETQPDARILFTSGYTEDAVVRQRLLQEGEQFIEKPFTPAALARKARELLAAEDGDES